MGNLQKLGALGEIDPVFALFALHFAHDVAAEDHAVEHALHLDQTAFLAMEVVAAHGPCCHVYRQWLDGPDGQLLVGESGRGADCHDEKNDDVANKLIHNRLDWVL